MNPDKIKDGDVLLDCHTHRAGNTSIRVMGTWHVNIDVVYRDSAGHVTHADVRWNGNRRTMRARDLAKLRTTPPEWARYDVTGGRRCSVCRNAQEKGHSDVCTHPRAIAARKRACCEERKHK